MSYDKLLYEAYGYPADDLVESTMRKNIKDLEELFSGLSRLDRDLKRLEADLSASRRANDHVRVSELIVIQRNTQEWISEHKRLIRYILDGMSEPVKILAATAMLKVAPVEKYADLFGMSKIDLERAMKAKLDRRKDRLPLVEPEDPTKPAHGKPRGFMWLHPTKSGKRIKGGYRKWKEPEDEDA